MLKTALAEDSHSRDVPSYRMMEKQSPVSSRGRTVHVSSIAPIRRCVWGLPLVLLGGACGGVSVGVGAVTDDDSSDADAPTSVGSLVITDTKESPAMVSFVLTDPESNPATVEMLYFPPGGGAGGAQPAQLVGDPSLVGLATSAQGESHSYEWDYASQVGSGASYGAGYTLFIGLDGGVQSVMAAANLGNDPPEIVSVETPAGESFGNVSITFTVADTSADLLDIQMEFDVQGDVPDAGWQLVHPAGTLAGNLTPIFAIRNLSSLASGTLSGVVWDTAFDLGGRELDVVVRIRARDELGFGGTVATAPFRIDNNQPPIALLSSEIVNANADRRRGISVPFTLVDAESDRVQVILQWRRENEAFPSLPLTSVENLREILDDPRLRREMQIGTELPIWLDGRVTALPPGLEPTRQVSLPELASSAASLVTAGLAGRTLEILRSTPELSVAAWSVSPLVAPVAALPVKDGPTALVLDNPAPGSWRLQEIDLATGALIRLIAAASGGDPSAMGYEQDEDSILLTAGTRGMWQVFRVGLGDGAVTALVSATDGSTELGTVRGIASLGNDTALLTVASSLVRVDFPTTAAARAIPLLQGLLTPWGIAIDPLRTNHIYLAERDAVVPGLPGIGVVSSVSLDTYSISTVAAFPRPEAIALERRGSRLLAVTDSNPFDGTRELRGVDLRGMEMSAVFELASALDADVSGLGVSPNGLRVLPLSVSNSLVVGGGVLQRRTLVEEPDSGHPSAPVPYDSESLVATVSEPFDPIPEPNARWRIADLAGRSSPLGTRNILVWDSNDSGGDLPVYLRIVPLDTDVGISDQSLSTKSLRSGWNVAPSVFEGAVASVSLLRAELGMDAVAADLDGDGLPDLALTNFDDDNLTVYFQSSLGEFSSTSDLTLGDTATTPDPYAVTAADLNGDGLADLVSANLSFPDGNLTVFFQSSPGVFASVPDLKLADSTTDYPSSVVAGDLNGDGFLDLAATSTRGAGVPVLMVFFQGAPGIFPDAPDLKLGDTTNFPNPISVAAADLNEDGLLDLISANTAGNGFVPALYGNNLTIHFQRSAGVFPILPDLTLGDASTMLFPYAVKAADLNHDGFMDLASGSSTGLTVFFQRETGVFRATPDVTLSKIKRGGLAITDINGDGFLDLATGTGMTLDGSNYDLVVFFRDTPGVFSEAVILTGQEFQPTSIVAGDLNGDGLLDLTTAHSNSLPGPFRDKLAIFFQRSAGTFSSVPDLILEDSSTAAYPNALLSADLNGDGLLDLAAAHGPSVGPANVSVFFQGAPGVFSNRPDLTLGTVAGDPSPVSLVAADLNGDGRLDLASANVADLGYTAAGNLTIFYQSGTGDFPATPSLAPGSADTTGSPGSIVAVDLNRDGSLDLISANTFSDNLAIFFQQGPGVFGSAPDFLLGDTSTTNAALALVAADLNEDGKLDLISGNGELSSANLTIFYQGSGAAFHETPDVTLDMPFTFGVRSLVVADLNGDGLLDLSAGDLPMVFFQNSQGTFPSVPDELPFSGGNGFASVSFLAEDLNRDGELDLAAIAAGGFDVGSPGFLSVIWNGL